MISPFLILYYQKQILFYSLALSLRSFEYTESAEFYIIFAGIKRMIHSGKPAYPAGKIYFRPARA